VWLFGGSLAVGALGYLIVTFWCEPILQFHRVRHQVTSDLIYFGNAFCTSGENLDDAVMERRRANRRHAADLVASYQRLPFFYRSWLEHNEENPSLAASEFIGLSNTVNWPEAEPRVRTIEKALGIGRVL